MGHIVLNEEQLGALKNHLASLRSDHANADHRNCQRPGETDVDPCICKRGNGAQILEAERAHLELLIQAIEPLVNATRSGHQGTEDAYRRALESGEEHLIEVMTASVETL